MTESLRVGLLPCLGMALCLGLFVVRSEGAEPAVAAGRAHSLILRADGSLFGMGGNSKGQLGDGTTTNRTTPVLIDRNVTAIAERFAYSFYFKSDGSLRAMGSNHRGQLGDGTTKARNISVLIDQNITAIAAGSAKSLYLKSEWLFFGDSPDLGEASFYDKAARTWISSSE